MQIFKGLIHKAKAATPLFQGIYSTGDKAWVTDAQDPHLHQASATCLQLFIPAGKAGPGDGGAVTVLTSVHGEGGWLRGENQLSPTLSSMGDSCTQHPLSSIKAQAVSPWIALMIFLCQL